MAPCQEFGWVARWRGPSDLTRNRQRIRVCFFAMEQAAALGVVVEDFGVASPVQCGLELALDFIRAEVLIEDITEELLANGMVAVGMQIVPQEQMDGDAALSNIAILRPS